MDTNAKIWKEAPQGAEINISEVYSKARETQEKPTLSVLESVETTPNNENLTWNVTPEQVHRINKGDRLSIDQFFFDNIRRLTFSAYKFIRNNAYVKTVASWEDMLNQAYIDLRTGATKLRPFDKAISGAIFHSFKYAPVGGFDDMYIYKTKERRQCQRTEN